MRTFICLASAVFGITSFADELPIAVLRFPGPAGVVERLTTAQYSPDGSQVVAASESGRVQVWDTRTLSPRLKCALDDILPKSDRTLIRDAKFSPDGRRVAVAGPRGAAWIWTLNDGDCRGHNLTFLNGHADDVRTIEFSRDGARLVTTGNDQTVRIWDAQGHAIKSIDLASGAVAATVPTGAAFSPDGRVIVVSRSDGLLAKIDADTFALTPLRDGRIGGQSITQIVFAGNAAVFATATDDGEVILWSTANGSRRVVSRPGELAVTSLALTPDGSRLAIGFSAERARNLPSHTSVFRLDGAGHLVRQFVAGPEAIAGVSFSPDGARVAIGAVDGTVRLWSADKTLAQHGHAY